MITHHCLHSPLTDIPSTWSPFYVHAICINVYMNMYIIYIVSYISVAREMAQWAYVVQY